MNDRQREVCHWARAHMEARDFVIVDTETTGLDETAEVVSVAVVNAWGKLAFYSLVKPSKPIDETGKAFQVNGISNAMVEFSRGHLDNVDVLLMLLLDKSVIAYNADFDARMIKQSFHLSVTTECAMLRYAKYRGEVWTSGVNKGEFVWQRLENACAQMGLPLRPYHDAASDALATYDLIKALSDRLDCAV